MQQVTYIGAVLDSSGYAEAARNYILALSQVGVAVKVKPLSFEQYKTNTCRLGSLVSNMVDRNANTDIQIIHTTPPVFSKFIDRSKYNIGYTVWETSRLPNEWVPMINQLDEVWVPAKHNVECFRNSGVTIPIQFIPHCIDEADAHAIDSPIENLDKDSTIFYSIFQWTERKNPEGLIRAYCSEFTDKDNVTLVLKTYIMTPGTQKEKEKLSETIKDIKNTLHLKNAPKVMLIHSLLSRDQIWSLHYNGSCFVSLHRAEGFGMPLIEAMLASKPVITTTYGGPADFINETNGYPIGYQMTPVSGMPWETYDSRQMWAEPNLEQAMQAMRNVHENKQKNFILGATGKKDVLTNYSWNTIGTLMKNRLMEIEAHR